MSINKRLDETSYHRMRRARTRRAEKLRMEMKSKLARDFSKGVEKEGRATGVPSVRGARPAPPPKVRKTRPAPPPIAQTVPVRVARPLPVRAVNPLAQAQAIQPIPLALPLAQPVPMHTAPVAVRATPSAMSVCSTSGMDIVSDGGYDQGMQGGRWAPWTSQQFPTQLPTPSPSLMDVRTSSAMEVEDDDHASRMSITPVPTPNRWGLPQCALHPDTHRLFVLEGRYNVLRGFVHHLYQSICEESFQAALDGVRGN